MAKADDDDDDEDDKLGRTRLDKWLWAARFYKTRRLAIEACTSGKVKIGDQVLKPGRNVNLGEKIAVTREQLVWEIVVTALSIRRGPATEAVKLYRETEEGRVAREAEIGQRKLAFSEGGALKGRPTKRDRRDIQRYRGRNEG